MKFLIFTLLFVAVVRPCLTAGTINVVHLGPTDVMKFEITAGDATQDFTLSHGADTGPFMLPEKPVTIKCFGDEIPRLEVPLSKDPRVALLIPGKKGFEWSLQTMKPSPEKWAFRIVNLSDGPAEVKSTEATFKIPGGGETSVEVSEKAHLNLQMGDAVNLTYEGIEPRGVVAFIYRDDKQWRAILLPDR